MSAHPTTTPANGIAQPHSGSTDQYLDQKPSHMSHEEHQTAQAAARFGYGPLARLNTNGEEFHPAFGGEFQPGRFRSVAQRKFANPAPLGLCAFALTTFVLSLINLNTRNVAEPNIVIGLAFAYGGLIQLLAGMWYVAQLLKKGQLRCGTSC
jgi:hypothetical protein